MIANQIRTPVDWISTIGPRHPCSQSSSLVRFVRETRAVRHFDIARGIDRQLTTQQQVRPRPFSGEIMSAVPRVIDRRRVPGSTSHKSPRFSSAAAKRKLPLRLFERGLLTHPRCLSRPQRRLSHDGQILRRHRQGRQGCVPDSSRPRA